MVYSVNLDALYTFYDIYCILVVPSLLYIYKEFVLF